MKRLILMRHAKSDWFIDGRDHDRPLNARGRQSASAMGRWLRDQDWLPDCILCSTATRTRQTLDLLRFDKQDVHYERRLYLADPKDITDALRTSQGDCILLIGHNPGIGDCALDLVATPPDHPRFSDYPTCATALIQFEIPDWNSLRTRSGRCAGFAIPREVIGNNTER